MRGPRLPLLAGSSVVPIVMSFAMALAASCLAVAPRASAASLRLSDGTRLTVEAVAVQERDGLRLMPRGATQLVWTHVAPSGDLVARGCIHGSFSLQRRDEPTLAADPVTGEVHLLEAEDGLFGGRLVLRTWAGQGFFGATELPGGDRLVARSPRLGFAPDGLAVVGWLGGSGSPSEAATLRLQALMLSPLGAETIVFYVEIPQPGRWLANVGFDPQLAAGVSHVAVSETADRAWVFVGEPASGEVAVFGAALDVLEDIWGGSAAPVPVTLVPDGGPEPLSSDEDADATDAMLGADPAGAWIVALSRLALRDWDVYSWRDGDVLRGVAFRDGEASPMVAIDAALREEDSAQRALLRSLSRVISALDGTAARQGAVDRRHAGR